MQYSSWGTYAGDVVGLRKLAGFFSVQALWVRNPRLGALIFNLSRVSICFSKHPNPICHGNVVSSWCVSWA